MTLPKTIIDKLHLTTLLKQKFTVSLSAVEYLEGRYQQIATEVVLPPRFSKTIRNIRKGIYRTFLIQVIASIIAIFAFGYLIWFSPSNGISTTSVWMPLIVLGLPTFAIYLFMNRMTYYNELKKGHLQFEHYHHGKDFVWPVSDRFDDNKAWEVFRVWDIE